MKKKLTDIPAPALKPMSVQQLMDFLNKIPVSQRQVEESTLQIVVLQPGNIGGTPTVGVEQAHFGFDWDARKLMLYPVQPLTKLSDEDVAAIHKSAKEGQSWHAYQQYTKQADRIKALEAEIARLTEIVDAAQDLFVEVRSLIVTLADYEENPVPINKNSGMVRLLETALWAYCAAYSKPSKADAPTK